MTSPATAFVDDAAVTAREAEVTGANFDNGMNVGGSNAPGIGVNMLEGAIVGTPNQFTLLDQQEPSGVARVPQISQCIGGFPDVPRTGNVATTWDRSQALYTANGAASSGGTEGILPEGSLRYGPQTTQSAKDADPALDGAMTFTANCTLNTLALGWVAAA